LGSISMAGQSPLVGYNTNVRHKGKLYHIQTEDSGVNHPHVITHLFADGGRIIASRKTGYAEHLGAKDLAGIVKKLMQEQHKAMFIELRDCVYDSEPPPAEAPRPSPPAAAASPAPPVAAAAPLTSAERPPAGASGAVAMPPVPPPVPRAASGDRMPAPTAGAAPPPVPPQAVGKAHLHAPNAPSQSAMRAPSVPLSPTDIEAFERAAEERLVGSVLNRAHVEGGRRGLGRYQQTVAAKPPRPQRPPSRSIFGGEVLRGKSLDEVILSYLSDDAGETER